MEFLLPKAPSIKAENAFVGLMFINAMSPMPSKSAITIADTETRACRATSADAVRNFTVSTFFMFTRNLSVLGNGGTL